MRNKFCGALVLVFLFVVNGCGGDSSTGAATTTTSSTATTTTSSSSNSCGLQDSANNALGIAVDAYSSGSTSLSSVDVDASSANESAICAENAGTIVTLSNPTISSSATASNLDDASFYGLDAAVLAYGSSPTTDTGGSITLTNGTITTSGQGGNGVFASGDGAAVTISGTSITTTGANAHALDAAYGGTLNIDGITASTSGASASVVATDRGGGTVTIEGGSYTSSGQRSAGLYSTGAITVTDGTFTANHAEAAVVEGANSLTLTGTKLVSSDGDDRGVFLYQSTSGDASTGSSTFAMTNGSISYTCSITACTEGDTASGQNNPATLFAAANTTATIALTGVTITNNVATLLTAQALNSGTWGTAGSNGASVTMTADNTALSGNIIVDDISTVALSLTDGSSLSGAINTADTAKSVALTLDSSSVWTVSGTSYVTSLTGLVIEGSSVTNIVGGGNTVYYVSADNTGLAGATYTLAGSGGGQLVPK